MVSRLQVRELICADNGRGNCDYDLDYQSEAMDIDTDRGVLDSSTVFLAFDK